MIRNGQYNKKYIMKLNSIIEGRKNVAYKSAVDAGTEIVYDQSGIVIRKLTTPEAMQHWSRHSCPGYSEPDPQPQPPCTVVMANAVRYVGQGSNYYCEINQKPIYLANVHHRVLPIIGNRGNRDGDVPDQKTITHSTWSFLDYRTSSYDNGTDKLAGLIKKLDNESNGVSPAPTEVSSTPTHHHSD